LNWRQFQRQKISAVVFTSAYHPCGCGKADTDAVPAGQADSGWPARCYPGPAQGAQAKGRLKTVSTQMKDRGENPISMSGSHLCIPRNETLISKK
jgi:hypothetical protein